MTMLIDNRDGSEEFLTPLEHLGLPVGLTRLEGGDFAWEGRGIKGKPVFVGVEFKKLNELVQAFRTNRLVGSQVFKMQEMGYDFTYLFIEGELHWDRQGRLLRRAGRREFHRLPGGMALGELLKRVFVLQLCGGLTPVWTRGRKETLQQLIALYRVWTDCDLDEHRSHIAIYRPPTLIPISEFRRLITGIEGIGVKTSLAIEQHFHGSVREAVNAPMQEWTKVEGVGPKLYAHIQEVLSGEAVRRKRK